jgi:hypothetical protein
MKKTLRIAPVLVLILALAVSCAANRAAFTTIGSVKIGVDLAMKAWVQNVATKGRCVAAATVSTSGCVLRSTEVQVRDALAKYKATAASLMVVLDASSTTPSPQQLSDAAASITSLVEQLTGKKVTP